MSKSKRSDSFCDPEQQRHRAECGQNEVGSGSDWNGTGLKSVELTSNLLDGTDIETAGLESVMLDCVAKMSFDQ